MNGAIAYEHREGAFCLSRLPYKESALAYISITSAVPHLSKVVPFWLTHVSIFPMRPSIRNHLSPLCYSHLNEQGWCCSEDAVHELAWPVLCP